MTTPDPVTDGNRYRAPQTRVADSSSPGARGTRPLTVWIAVLVLLVTAALEFVPLTREGLGKLPPTVLLASLAAFGVTMLVVFAMIWMIFRGAAWARLVYLSIFAIMTMASSPGTMSRMSLIKVLAQVIAIGLLFVPPANAWFRQRDS